MVPGYDASGSTTKENKKLGEKEHVSRSHLAGKRKHTDTGAPLSPFQKLLSQKVGLTQTKPSSRKEAQADTSNKPPKIVKLSQASFLPSDASESSETDEEDDTQQDTSMISKILDDKKGDESVIVIDSESDGEGMFNPESLPHCAWFKWTPKPRVAKYLVERMRTPLDKDVRNRLKEDCPRPYVEDRVTATPTLDPAVINIAQYIKDPKKGIDRSWRACQDKLLDITGPLAKILEMAETAKTAGELVDPTVLIGLAQRAICLLGNANCAVSVERRKSILMKLDPKWTSLALLEAGPLAKGMLFGDAFVKELENLIESLSAADKGHKPTSETFPSGAFGRAGRYRGRRPFRGYNQDRQQGQYEEFQDSEPSRFNTFFPSRARPYRGRRRGYYAGMDSKQGY